MCAAASSRGSFGRPGRGGSSRRTNFTTSFLKAAGLREISSAQSCFTRLAKWRTNSSRLCMTQVFRGLLAKALGKSFWMALARRSRWPQSRGCANPTSASSTSRIYLGTIGNKTPRFLLHWRRRGVGNTGVKLGWTYLGRKRSAVRIRAPRPILSNHLARHSPWLPSTPGLTGSVRPSSRCLSSLRSLQHIPRS